MNQLLEAAFIKAISIESQSLNLYRTMAFKAGDDRTRAMFERMADEESEHLKSFLNSYPGDIFELLQKIGQQTSPAQPKHRELLDSAGCVTDELKALEISLLEEQACIDYYAMFVDIIRDASIHEVFLRALTDTRNHLDIISDEYLRRREINEERSTLNGLANGANGF